MINNYIDHTLLKPTATKEQIRKLCFEAIENKFYSVCVNPFYVPLAKTMLQGTNVKIACVVGFPLGQNSTAIKCAEAREAVANGADEIDMVINEAEVKNGNYIYVLHEINEIKKACGVLLKVIIETSQLEQNEIIKMCEIVNESNAECIKTSTGFVGGRAEIETVKIMVKSMKNNKFVKASGGIRDYVTAKQMIDIGAKRLGVSAGVQIMEQEKFNH